MFFKWIVFIDIDWGVFCVYSFVCLVVNYISIWRVLVNLWWEKLLEIVVCFLNKKYMYLF